MRAFLKKYANLLNVLFAVAVLAIIVAINGDIGEIWESLTQLKLRWILFGAGLLGVYLLLRATALRFYLRRQGYPLPVVDALIVTGVGQFYSAITPSSTGGQPMQVVHLMRRGIPGTVASAAVSVKFLCFQLSVLVLGAVTWSLNGSFVDMQLGPAKALVFFGFFINSALLAGVFLAIINRALVERVLGWALRLLHKMHLIKEEEEARARAIQALDEYRRSLLTLKRRPLDALMMLALAVAQVICCMSIVICVYWSFGLNTASIMELFTMQMLLFLSAAFVPLPGAAGAQEGGFYIFFRGLFPEGVIVPAMIAWRLFTYYLQLFSGLIAVIWDNLRTALAHKREEKRHGKN